ncbi:MAG: exo-beta-N-acetylmuramidase NamZ family protein [Gemmatimonadales bacterium]
MRSKHGRLGVKVGLVVALAGCARAPAPGTPAAVGLVRPGIEVLLTDSARVWQGRRLGLVTNQGGIDRAGVHAVDRLRAAGARLVALFSPEHGFRGAAAPGEAVVSTTDSATGLPIYSLYGRTRAPTDSMLTGIDLLLVDLPDVGARYYTYLSTTIEVMRAAGRRKIPVAVLDRPNPIGGSVHGEVLDTAFRSFVGALAVPNRHGLTLGEQALLAREELGIDVTVTVIPAHGWRRSMLFGMTGLPFIPPSPNLKDVEALFHYPGTCLFEGTALSVGRGSDAPYRQIGAPWLDAERVIAMVSGADRRGVLLKPVTFTPDHPADGKHAGIEVRGIRLHLFDSDAYDPVRTAVALLAAIQRVHPEQIGWNQRGFDRLAGGATLREAILAGRSPEEVASGWRVARDAFRDRARRIRIYR